MANSISFGTLERSSLTNADVAKLFHENLITVRKEEYGILHEEAPILKRTILRDGKPLLSQKGEEITEISTILVVRRPDGSKSVGRVTLPWISGEDLVEEGNCPLLYCKDGVRKYAATHTLTHVSTRDFSLNLKVGSDTIGETMVFLGGEPIEGYREPRFDQVWTQVGGTWVNKENLGDSLSLVKIKKASLSLIENPLTKKELDEVLLLVKDAVRKLGVK